MIRPLWLLATLCLSITAQASDLIVHAGILYDGVTETPRSNMSVVIHDERVIAIQAGFVTTPNAHIIDLSTSTVLPGFIDCHIHMTATLPSQSNATEQWLTHSDLDRAFNATVFMRDLLSQGFTSARDLGGGNETVAVKHAIDSGKIPGPRLWVSLEPLGPTAGHGDPYNGLDPALNHPGWDSGKVDSSDEARFRVREHRRRGADLIKIMPSGGIASTGDDPQRTLMTDDEIRTIVSTAHALGMQVAAHTYPSAAIDSAVRAGVDSIEHGSFANSATLALMKAHGTFLVPTLTVYEVFYQVAHDRPDLLAPGTAAKELANDLLPKAHFPLAAKSGVRIAYGTDLGEGDHTMEFKLLTANGLSVGRAILSATSEAATLIGAADQIGSLQAGRYADLVAIDGDLTEDSSAFSRVHFVMKGGHVVRAKGQPLGLAQP